MSIFKLVGKKNKARLGKLKTLHGEIETPFFMSIATSGFIKGLTTDEMREINAPVILSNTYHLMLRPGEKLIKRAGGLHEFMNWEKPILTDSGGYQVFSLAKFRKILDSGVKFKSGIDGKEYFLTPRKAIQIQQDLGSDIMMVLDECVENPASYNVALEAVERTTRWAKLCRKIFNDQFSISNKFSMTNFQINRPLLFGIVQGSLYKDLRKKSADDLIKIGFDGYAIGGLAVGEGKSEMYKMVEYSANLLPEDKPRYLMGVGYPEDIVKAVSLGIDMFDCVIPTRNARHGMLFTGLKNIDLKKGTVKYKALNITNKEFREDFKPVDKNCDCELCKNYSRSYLRHLFMSKSFLGQRLATLHNLRFYVRLMEALREEVL